MRFVGWFQAIVGGSVVGLWSVLLLTSQVPEVQAGQVDIWFHLAAELAMAGLLVGAGWAVLRRTRWARRLSAVALGLLAYSVINSSGYYAESDDWAMVGMFGVVLVGTIVSIVQVWLGGWDDGSGDTVAPGTDRGLGAPA